MNFLSTEILSPDLSADGRTRRRRLAFLPSVLGTLVAVLVLPASAGAVSGSVAGDTLTLTGGPENNNVEIDQADHAIRVKDAAGLTLGPGCMTDPYESGAMVCGNATTTKLVVNLGDGNNTFKGPGTGILTYWQDLTTITINGGAGRDTIDTGFLDLHDTDPGWRLNAGAGTETITAGTGNNIIKGGPGTNTIYGSSGHGTILGGSGTNTINGGSGNWTIDGTAGTNDIEAGRGVNTINTVNGRADRVTCSVYGHGYDTVTADQFDIVDTSPLGCNAVTRVSTGGARPGTGGGGARKRRAAKRCSTRKKRKGKARSAARKKKGKKKKSCKGKKKKSKKKRK